MEESTEKAKKNKVLIIVCSAYSQATWAARKSLIIQQPTQQKPATYVKRVLFHRTSCVLNIEYHKYQKWEHQYREYDVPSVIWFDSSAGTLQLNNRRLTVYLEQAMGSARLGTRIPPENPITILFAFLQTHISCRRASSRSADMISGRTHQRHQKVRHCSLHQTILIFMIAIQVMILVIMMVLMLMMAMKIRMYFVRASSTW